MIDKLSQLLDKHGNPSARKISVNPALSAEIVGATQWLSSSAGIAERMWNLTHNYIQYHKKCEHCGNDVKSFRSWTEGYAARFCSRSCQRIKAHKEPNTKTHEEILLGKERGKIKRAETSFARYGVNATWNIKKTIDTKRQIISDRFALSRPDLKMESDYLDSRTQMTWSCVACNTHFESSTFQTPTCPHCFTRSASKGQHEINDFIRSLGVSTRLNDRKKCKGKFELDIWVPSLDICIEYDGLYWHSEKGRADIKDRSLKKFEFLKTLGIKQLNVFEDDWHNKQEIIKARITSALGLNIKVAGRKTVVKTISSKEAAEFCDLYHLQGRGVATIALGLYLNSELISVMTFAKPRFSAVLDLELIRYCTKGGLTVVGGASKLWSAFIKLHPNKTIISYSDNRWGSGNVYSNLGFKNSGQTGQGYFYVTTNGQRISRSKAQKKQLKSFLPNFDEALTERDNCWNNKLYRVWTLGNTRWIFTHTT